MGRRSLLVKPWANGTGKGNTCQLCRLKVQADQSKVTEAACRVGETMEEMAKLKCLREPNLE